MDVRGLSRMILLLRVLVYVVIAMIIIIPIVVVADGEEIHLKIDGQMWTRKLNEFWILDALVVNLVIWSPRIAWLYGVLQIERLCRLFARGEIFARGNIACFKRFAIALMAMSVLGSIALPALAHYLLAVGEIRSLPEMPVLYLVEADYFMAGVLFLVIARIVEIGMDLKTDTELTI